MIGFIQSVYLFLCICVIVIVYLFLDVYVVVYLSKFIFHFPAGLRFPLYRWWLGLFNLVLDDNTISPSIQYNCLLLYPATEANKWETVLFPSDYIDNRLDCQKIKMSSWSSSFFLEAKFCWLWISTDICFFWTKCCNLEKKYLSKYLHRFCWKYFYFKKHLTRSQFFR